MLIIGCVCSLWQVLVNDLKWSPGGPRYDCTNCCFVTRGSIMGDQGERGRCQGSWTLDCLLCHRKVQDGPTYIDVPSNLTMTERSRGGKPLDVLGRIVWNNSWRVVFNKHGRCKLSTELLLLSFPCVCVPFTSVVCWVICLIFYRLDTSCT